jgi:Xaa-Pro dipeptidase
VGRHHALNPLPASFYEDVRERLRTRAQAAGLDGLLILAAGNVTYATGWHFSVNERPVGLWLPVEGSALLLVAHLELENAMDVRGVEVRTYAEFPGERPPVLWMIEEAGVRRIAVDSLSAELLEPAEALLDRLDLTDHTSFERAVKHPLELALIHEASRFADLVLERLLSAGGDIIAQGGSEEDLLADCTRHVRDILFGTHGAAFQGTKVGITATVHSGPRAALPHGTVTSRRPQPGEPIIAGIGCSLGGYHAESGVTLVLGEISKAQRKVMNAMADAGAATVDALQRGLTCAQVNDAATAPIRGAGLGDAIRHRIGHGMGVEGHESPWLAPGDHTPTTPGMVFSCEPGVYRPGLDGWRTIDTLVVGPDRVELASRFQTHHPLDTRTLPC